MLKIGLTGSIAVGKSYVSAVLAEHGCRVLDADLTAREVVRPGNQGLEAVVAEFGREILNEDGTLNRSALAAIIFDDDEKRQRLDSILHPLIIDLQEQWVREQFDDDPEAVVVIDAALMIESGSYKRFEEIIVVWCEPEIQVERLQDRDTITRKEAEAKIAAQLPQERKKEYGDFLIDTSGDFDSTRRNTEAVLRGLEAKHGVRFKW